MNDYWEKRSTALELSIQKKTDETICEVNSMYEEAVESINERVRKVFDRYAGHGGLTADEALKLLNTKQTAQHRDELLSILAQTTDKKARAAIIAELDAPAYAYRISMLEALANEIYAEGIVLGVYEKGTLTQRLIDIYEQSYYQRTFDIQQYTGEYYDFTKLSSARMRAAVSEQWNSKNYSERIWDNTEKTAQSLKKTVIQGIMTGQDYKTLESALTAILGIDSDSGARFRASRLIRTEVNYISGKATTKAYMEAEIDEYIYLATLDKKTCHDCGSENRKSCAELDGKHFKVSEAKVGVNKHPMHPFCRCSDCPYIPGRKSIKRAARDENGKSIQVPADMTYFEWKEKFVDETEKIKYNKAKQNVLEELKKYSKSMNEGAQTKHIRGSHNFDEKKSELSENPKMLFDYYYENSEPIYNKSGKWVQKNRFTHNSDIGIYRNKYAGEEIKTNSGIIHFSKKKGWHIVPAKSKKGNK